MATPATPLVPEARADPQALLTRVEDTIERYGGSFGRSGDITESGSRITYHVGLPGKNLLPLLKGLGMSGVVQRSSVDLDAASEERVMVTIVVTID
jgi:hypothetical protein